MRTCSKGSIQIRDFYGLQLWTQSLSWWSDLVSPCVTMCHRCHLVMGATPWTCQAQIQLRRRDRKMRRTGSDQLNLGPVKKRNQRRNHPSYFNLLQVTSSCFKLLQVASSYPVCRSAKHHVDFSFQTLTSRTTSHELSPVVCWQQASQILLSNQAEETHYLFHCKQVLIEVVPTR